MHSRGKLALTAIGTSQEGADVATIRQIALMCKMAGADIHHIGDTGVPGMALPQNIMAYSIAIRGERHNYHKWHSRSTADNSKLPAGILRSCGQFLLQIAVILGLAS